MTSLPPSRPSAILFDFDGTLAPNLDLPDMRRQVIELTRNNAVPDEVWQGCYIVEIINAAREHLNQRDTQRADLYFQRGHQLITDIEMSAARTTSVFAWTREVLERVRFQGIRTAIVTRNNEAAVRATFPDLDDYVDLLLARDNVTHLKPDPRHFAVALERLDHRCQTANRRRRHRVACGGVLRRGIVPAANAACDGVVRRTESGTAGGPRTGPSHDVGFAAAIEFCFSSQSGGTAAGTV